jgi:hypothetical protein
MKIYSAFLNINWVRKRPHSFELHFALMISNVS